MERIELENVLPAVFAGRENIVSDVWRKKLSFAKGKSYLIEAASGTGKSSALQFYIWLQKGL